MSRTITIENTKTGKLETIENVKGYLLFTYDRDGKYTRATHNMPVGPVVALMERDENLMNAALSIAIHRLIDDMSDQDEEIEKLQAAFNEIDAEVREDLL